MAKQCFRVYSREELQDAFHLAEVSRKDCRYIGSHSPWKVFEGPLDKGAYRITSDGTLLVSVDGTSDFPEAVSDAMTGGFARFVFPWMWRTLKMHWSFNKHGGKMAKDLIEKVDWSRVRRVVFYCHSRGVNLSEKIACVIGSKRKMKKLGLEDIPEVIGFGGAVGWTLRGIRWIRKAKRYIMQRVYSVDDIVPKINFGPEWFRFYFYSSVEYRFDGLPGIFDHTNYDLVLAKCAFTVIPEDENAEV